MGSWTNTASAHLAWVHLYCSRLPLWNHFFKTQVNYLTRNPLTSHSLFPTWTPNDWRFVGPPVTFHQNPNVPFLLGKVQGFGSLGHASLLHHVLLQLKMTWVSLWEKHIHIFHALSPLGVPSHCYWSLENHQNSAVWRLVHDVWMAIVHSGLRGHHAVPSAFVDVRACFQRDLYSFFLLTPVKNWKSTWAHAVPWYQKLKQQVSVIEQNEPSIPSHAQKFQHQLVKTVIQIDAANAILFWCFHDFHLASATFRLLRLLFRLLATSDTCVQSQPPIGKDTGKC